MSKGRLFSQLVSGAQAGSTISNIKLNSLFIDSDVDNLGILCQNVWQPVPLEEDVIAIYQLDTPVRVRYSYKRRHCLIWYSTARMDNVDHNALHLHKNQKSVQAYFFSGYHRFDVYGRNVECELSLGEFTRLAAGSALFEIHHSRGVRFRLAKDTTAEAWVFTERV